MAINYEVKVTRQALVNNFIIYFWVDDENAKVQVIAVIYEKRDQLEQLKRIQFCTKQ